MESLTTFGQIYLTIGLAHGVYLLLNGSSTIWWFPVNVLGGPPVLLYIIYKTLKREKINYP